MKLFIFVTTVLFVSSISSVSALTSEQIFGKEFLHQGVKNKTTLKLTDQLGKSPVCVRVQMRAQKEAESPEDAALRQALVGGVKQLSDTVIKAGIGIATGGASIGAELASNIANQAQSDSKESGAAEGDKDVGKSEGEAEEELDISEADEALADLDIIAFEATAASDNLQALEEVQTASELSEEQKKERFFTLIQSFIEIKTRIADLEKDIIATGDPDKTREALELLAQANKLEAEIKTVAPDETEFTNLFETAIALDKAVRQGETQKQAELDKVKKQLAQTGLGVGVNLGTAILDNALKAAFTERQDFNFKMAFFRTDGSVHFEKKKNVSSVNRIEAQGPYEKVTVQTQPNIEVRGRITPSHDIQEGPVLSQDCLKKIDKDINLKTNLLFQTKRKIIQVEKELTKNKATLKKLNEQIVKAENKGKTISLSKLKAKRKLEDDIRIQAQEAVLLLKKDKAVDENIKRLQTSAEILVSEINI